MENTKLMKLVPLSFDSNNRLNTSDLISKLLQIVLKIAHIKGYNKNFNIQFNETFVPESNIANNISELFLTDKKMDDSFINLLNRAEIKPEMIQNKTAREQLKDWNLSSQQNITPRVISREKKIKRKLKPIKRNNQMLFAPNKILNKSMPKVKWEEASDSDQ